jgi:sensor histidine kinase YesM
LIFKIENSKNTIKVKDENYSKGIGLQNARKRLDLIYLEKYILKIEEKDDTYSVNLTLEL